MDKIIPSLQLNLKNSWQIDEELKLEFTPSPEETQLIIKENYTSICVTNQLNNLANRPSQYKIQHYYSVSS